MAEAKEKAAPEPAEEKIEKIWVQGTAKPRPDGGSEILLHEFDEAHPDGEILITGNTPIQVGETDAVAALLSKGKIKKTSAPRKSAEAEK